SVRQAWLEQTGPKAQVAQRDRCNVRSRQELEDAPGGAIEMRQMRQLEALQEVGAIAVRVGPVPVRRVTVAVATCELAHELEHQQGVTARLRVDIVAEVRVDFTAWEHLA